MFEKKKNNRLVLLEKWKTLSLWIPIKPTHVSASLHVAFGSLIYLPLDQHQWHSSSDNSLLWGLSCTLYDRMFGGIQWSLRIQCWKLHPPRFDSRKCLQTLSNLSGGMREDYGTVMPKLETRYINSHRTGPAAFPIDSPCPWSWAWHRGGAQEMLIWCMVAGVCVRSVTSIMSNSWQHYGL